ncbi:MAG: nuclear transport factor 2 family protein [Actinomycetota bacterium]|nr:nuclear transport factor 2 family protein [Actinomycetota bacterium]
MSTTSRHRAALSTALAYHRAWTGGDFEAAMTYVAPDIVCHAPAGTLHGADAFRDFMGPFAAMLRGSVLVGAFGDDDVALLMYGTATALVADAPGAEWQRVVDGRIVELRIIFDRLPFEQARSAAAGS